MHAGNIYKAANGLRKSFASCANLTRQEKKEAIIQLVQICKKSNCSSGERDQYEWTFEDSNGVRHNICRLVTVVIQLYRFFRR
jgi:hypothetical protein